MNGEWEAVKALIESVPKLAGRVKDSTVDGDGKAVRGTYLVLYSAAPDELTDDRWSTVQRPDSDASYSFPVRAVADDPGALRLLVGLVAQIAGRKPLVAGRRCDPVELDFDEAKKDTSVTPPLYFLDVWINFWSRRGSA